MRRAPSCRSASGPLRCRLCRTWVAERRLPPRAGSRHAPDAACTMPLLTSTAAFLRVTATRRLLLRGHRGAAAERLPTHDQDIE